MLVESKLNPPSSRPGIVPRTALIARLAAMEAAPIICVVAPPGYGKTTLLAQWAEGKRPRSAWVTLDERDNDPVVLLTYIGVALDRVEPIDPRIFRTLAAPGAAVLATVLPRFASALSALSAPVALVLDHVELLHNPECIDALIELAGRLPAGSQIAFASRVQPPLPAALQRVRDRVARIGPGELSMGEDEARALLEGTGAEPGAAEVAELTRRTEGWPVALYLAALAVQAGEPVGDGDSGGSGGRFAGDERLMADYLWSELLSSLDPRTVSFLTRASVLERMSGPLCDAVLQVTGSAARLELLARSNLLLIPLDQEGAWFRFHHLLRDLLRAELGRREPGLVTQLHARAAAWCETAGLLESAIDHAQAAGDADRVARLVAGQVLPAYASGREDTVRRWLAWFEAHDLIERYPPVAVLGTWMEALTGMAVAAERWADAAERGGEDGVLPDGSTMESYRAMLRALLCRDGIDQLRADARLALTGLGPGHQWRATALLLEGMAELMAGEPGRADAVLGRAAELALTAGAMPAASVALAERALLAMDSGRWSEAADLAEQACSIVRGGHLDDYVPSAITYAATARVAARDDPARAGESLARAARLRPKLTYVMPHVALQTRLELARALLALDDAAGARVVLREARAIIQRRPALGVLPQRADELWAKLDSMQRRTSGASSLTTAELRLLPLLSTHLSFWEIGERLYLSRHTVKSQAMSVYRKLGASSRGEAIRLAQHGGLLDP